MWDVVNELVGLCTMPPPDNPFSLNMLYLQTLPLTQRFLSTGALLNFLEIIVIQGSHKELFYDLGGCLDGDPGFMVIRLGKVDSYTVCVCIGYIFGQTLNKTMKNLLYLYLIEYMKV